MRVNVYNDADGACVGSELPLADIVGAERVDEWREALARDGLCILDESLGVGPVYTILSTEDYRLSIDEARAIRAALEVIDDGTAPANLGMDDAAFRALLAKFAPRKTYEEARR